jgi:hypothetical protein
MEEWKHIGLVCASWQHDKLIGWACTTCQHAAWQAHRRGLHKMTARQIETQHIGFARSTAGPRKMAAWQAHHCELLESNSSLASSSGPPPPFRSPRLRRRIGKLVHGLGLALVFVEGSGLALVFVESFGLALVIVAGLGLALVFAVADFLNREAARLCG